jgi:hypothetical protein
MIEAILLVFATVAFIAASGKVPIVLVLWALWLAVHAALARRRRLAERAALAKGGR